MKIINNLNTDFVICHENGSFFTLSSGKTAEITFKSENDSVIINGVQYFENDNVEVVLRE